VPERAIELTQDDSDLRIDLASPQRDLQVQTIVAGDGNDAHGLGHACGAQRLVASRPQLNDVVAASRAQFVADA